MDMTLSETNKYII